MSNQTMAELVPWKRKAIGEAGAKCRLLLRERSYSQIGYTLGQFSVLSGETIVAFVEQNLGRPIGEADMAVLMASVAIGRAFKKW